MVILESHRDWVAFDHDHGAFEAPSSETWARPGDKRRSQRRSKVTKKASSWMDVPVTSSQSVVPLTTSRRANGSRSATTSPTRMHRAVQSPHRSESSGSLPDGTPRFVGRSRENQVPEQHARSTSKVSTPRTTTTQSAAPARPPVPTHAQSPRRAVSDSTLATRGRSSSQPSATRGRERPRSRSSSRSRVSVSDSRSNETRGRAKDRSRPPTTRSTRGQPRARSRSRSASLTRVTGPDSPAVSAKRTNRPPPSTYRTQKEMRTNRSNSIGPGVRASSRQGHSSSEEGSASTWDANIGRNISFSGSESNVVDENLDRNCTKKRTGLMEKLFGTSDKSMSLSTDSTEIRPRILLAATVYHNTATNLWIATINTNQKGVAKNPALANKYLKAFSFPTEREARESAIANAPPKMIPYSESSKCFGCQSKFAVFRRASQCRNCGVCVCNNCSTTWNGKCVPETYNLKNESSVKVCKSCNDLSTSFKKALEDGDYQEAVALYGTGNVNLRSPFPSTKKDETMYPIHSAVEGGNIHIVHWLIEDHFCPIKLVRNGRAKRNSGDSMLPTSKGRTALSIAMDRMKIDVLRYLVIDCGVSIMEATDLRSSLRALEAALVALPKHILSDMPRGDEPNIARWDGASFDEMSEPSSLGDSIPAPADDAGTVGSKSQRTRSSRNDSCIICYDNKINCVATPCGHQVCCLECSNNLSACPVCNNRGDFIKIFRP